MASLVFNFHKVGPSDIEDGLKRGVYRSEAHPQIEKRFEVVRYKDIGKIFQKEMDRRGCLCPNFTCMK